MVVWWCILDKMTKSSQNITMSHTEQTAYFSLIRAGKVVVTTRLLREMLNISHDFAAKILWRLMAKGSAQRIGRGIYVLKPPEILQGSGEFVQDTVLVVNQFMELSKSSYALAYLSAAHFYGLLEQLPHVTQVMTLRQRRTLWLSKKQVVHFITVKPDKFFGVTERKYGEQIVKITSLEKTALDCLDRLDLVGGLAQAVQILLAAADKIDERKLLKNARNIKNRSLLQRLGYILEKFHKFPSAAKKLGETKYPVPVSLDPRSYQKGRLNNKWQVKENVDIKL